MINWLNNNRRMYETVCGDIVYMQKQKAGEVVQVRLEATDIAAPKGILSYCNDTLAALKSQVSIAGHPEILEREFPLHRFPWTRELAMKESVGRVASISEALVRQFNATTLAEIVRVQFRDIAQYEVRNYPHVQSSLPAPAIKLIEANRYFNMLSLS